MESFNEILRGETPVLVDFYATWCGPCKMMHPVLEELHRDMGDKVRIIKVDIDKNRQLAELYRVQSVPTLMIFRNGEMKWRQAGVHSVAELKKALDSIA